jgi:hypothetical protein
MVFLENTARILLRPKKCAMLPRTYATGRSANTHRFLPKVLMMIPAP